MLICYFPPAFMSLQILHHLRLVEGHSTSQRCSDGEVSRHTLDNVHLLPPLLRTVCLFPCPLCPWLTWSHTACHLLWHQMLSDWFQNLFWNLSLAALLLHPCWITVCFQQLSTSSLENTSLPMRFPLICGVPLSVVKMFKWHVVWASWLSFPVLHTQCQSLERDTHA